MMCSGIVCYDYLPEDIRQKFKYENMMASKSILDPTKTFGDALYAAAEALCYLHTEIDKLNIPELVYTTGEIVCHPCVPDYVDFSIDVRHKDAEALEKVLAIVKSCGDKEWAGCKCEVEKAWNRDTVYWTKSL